MKARSRGRQLNKGSMTLEILLAFTVLIICMTAVISIGFGNQSIAVDSETNNEALSRATKSLEDLRAASRKDYSSIIPSTSIDIVGPLSYTKDILVRDITQCKKQATSTVSWQTGIKTQKIELTTYLSDISGALALGGDCMIDPPTGGWNPPLPYASDNFNPGKPTALDVLDKVAYVGGDKAPFLFIADASAATLGQTSGLFVSYANNFNSTGKTIDQIDDIDVVRNSANGKTYAYIAMASTTAQLAVVDVTDINNPMLTSKKKLSGITATDSTAWGWRVFYYNGKLYVTSRETAGPEFHIFDLSSMSNPSEIYSTELNTTVNDFVVKNNIAYFADDSDARGEVLVYNVSGNPSEILGARTDLPGNANALSIFAFGSKLYVGRQSNVNEEMYILDTSNTSTATGGLPVLSKKEIGNDVTDILIANPFAFLAVAKSNQEFQVWPYDFSGSAINIYNFGNVITGGIDADSDWVYVASQAADSLQILYSAPPFAYALSNNGPISVVQGSSGSATITKTYLSGPASNVALSVTGLPTGATYSLANGTCTPTCSSTITINTTLSTPAGSYPITITGTGGVTTTLTLNVSTQPFDYSLNTPAAVSLVRAGSNQTRTLTATLTSGNTQAVSFTNTALPSGVSLSYSVTTCNPTCSTTLTFTAASNAALVTNQPITINASPNAKSTTFNLSVTAPTGTFSLPSPMSDIVMSKGGAAMPVSVTVTMNAGAVPQSITVTPPNPAVADITITPATASCTPTDTAPYTCTVNFSYQAKSSAIKKSYTNQVFTGTGGIQSGKFKVIVQ